MVNLFGDVPLATTTDYTINARLLCIPSDEVYQQIITDLKEAESLLSTEYLDANLKSYGGLLVKECVQQMGGLRNARKSVFIPGGFLKRRSKRYCL